MKSSDVRPEPPPARGALVLSVSKRLAPAAPLRNMIRRVLRESWRYQAWVGRSASLAVMIRLRALPIGSPDSNVSAVPSKLPKGRAVLRIRQPDRALKAVIRAEADFLFQGLIRSMSLTETDR